MNSRNWSLLIAVLAAGSALGQAVIPGSGAVVKPRVFVIFDTSTSMKSPPSGFYDPGIAHQDTSTDPDLSPVLDTECQTKFCIAKKTVYEVLSDYVSSSIRLGLGTYYQYLVKYDPVDQRLSKCWYDAMWKPGRTMYLPRNGGWLPDSSALTNLSNVNLSAAATAAIRNVSNHGACRSSADARFTHSYNLIVDGTNPAGVLNCTLYRQPTDPGATLTLSGTTPTGCTTTSCGCTSGRTYNKVSHNQREPGVYRWRIPAAGTCPAGVPMAPSYAAVPASQYRDVSPGVSDAVCDLATNPYQTDCWVPGSVPFTVGSTGATCSAGYPCRMYSASAGGETPENVPVNWAGFFQGACAATPDGTESNGTTGVCVSPTITTGFVPGGLFQAGRTNGATGLIMNGVDEGVGGTCNGLPVGGPLQRISSGNINTFVGNFRTQAASALSIPVSSIDPGLTGDCGTMACDVRLASRPFRANDIQNTDVNQCTAGGSVTCDDGAVADPLRRLLKSGSCPAATTYSSPAAPAVDGAWETTGWHATCVAGQECQMSVNATAEAGGTMPSCAASAFRFDGNTPPACTYLTLTRNYAASGVLQTFSVYKDEAPGATCGATAADMTYVGSNAASVTQLGNCLAAAGGCRLYAPASTASPVNEFHTDDFTNAPPAATPAWGGRTELNQGTYYFRPREATGCPSYVDGQFYNLDGRNLRFRAGPGPNGSTQNGMIDENPLYMCRFENVKVQWSRPRTRCSYEIRRQDFTVDNSLTWCQYNQKRIRRTVTTPMYRCNYEVPVQQFTFPRPNHKVCEYFRTQTELTRDTPQVRYSYQTLGGELIGSYFRELPSIDTETQPYAAYSASCPVVLDDCLGSGTTCFLRNTTTNPAAFGNVALTSVTNALVTTNRYSTFNANQSFKFPVALDGGVGGQIAPADVQGGQLTSTAGHAGLRVDFTAPPLVRSGYACRMADFTTPPAAEPAKTAYTKFNGLVLPQPQFKLVSDYLDCADENNPASCAPNDISALNGDTRTGANLKPSSLGTYADLTNASWTATPTKAFGASASGPAYQTPGMFMMRFPSDGDADGDRPDFKRLMSRCRRPSPTDDAVPPAMTSPWSGRVTWPAPVASTTPYLDRAGNKVEWNNFGLCMPDIGAPNSAVPEPLKDFTPLYGSLRNVKRYLEEALATDVNHECRKYFVVLATDGKENTPRVDYQALTALQDAVSDLRATTSSNGRTTDVNTFVLGFGDVSLNPTDAYNLNQMAIAGNTGGAYFATNRADLQVRLAQIFNTITQGTYSRSRPVLTSDGKGLYAAYFDIRTNTAEWDGKFAAIEFDSGGNQLLRWELSKKLNDGMTDADRKIYTSVAGTRREWTIPNAGLITPLLNTDTNYPGGPGYSGATTATALNPERVLRFVRNLAKVTGNGTTGEDYFQNTPPVDKRLSRYGATIRSIPVVVSKSFNSPEWGGSASTPSRASYATFQTNVQNREQRVILGASDGIIRGVRDRVTADTNCQSSTDAGLDDSAATCSNGKEAWGYVPEHLQPILYRSMEKTIAGVDGEIWLDDICVATDAENCDLADWRTVALVGMRGGARGVQALDVTIPNDPKPMWKFERARGDPQLGYPITGALGRVEISGNKDRFIAVVPGGTRRLGVFGDLDESHGDEVYVFNAATGVELEFFNSNGDDDCDENASEKVLGCHDINGEDNQFLSKPSYFRRSGSPYMDNMVFSGTSGLVYISRFRKKVQVQGNGTIKVDARDSERWEPVRFFDPTNNDTSKNPTGGTVRVRRVVVKPTGYALEDCAGGSYPGNSTCGALPFSDPDRRLPLHNRPRVATIYDTAGLTADYYFGTGDTLSPTNPSGDFTWNYFYALHDGNDRNDGRDDARPLWVNQFINEREQVLADAVLINGNVLVTTYLPPPSSASDCREPGSAFLYCFNPKNGDLVNCLVDGGVRTSVRPLGPIGIPTPPQCLGSDCFVLGSNSPVGPDGAPRLSRTTITPPTPSGDTRSFRRVR